MAKKENLDQLAVWLTPNAIRQHVVFHYDEDNRIRNWVNQASDDELKEIILQTIPYSGLPRALSAMALLRRIQQGAKLEL